jgi:hypothetical protein
LLAIIKLMEDRMNVEHDTTLVGVQSILLVENSVSYYSYFLPIIYQAVMQQTQRLISEGINLSHKQLRQRARPKILLSHSYEEALALFQKYQDTILGVISDIDFPRDNKPDSQAGFRLAETIKKINPDIPILFHSGVPRNEQQALELGSAFLNKHSPRLEDEFKKFMINHLYLGDFIFRMPDGTVVGRASDLLSLENELAVIPNESFKYHAERNHFSNWLKARTEFWLAHELRPRKVTDYPSIDDSRKDVINVLQDYRRLRQRGIITDFKKNSFDPYSSISRIGGGALGGKARGLSFVNILLNNYNVQNRLEGVQIYIPPAVVIGTDVFDKFMEENDLWDRALQETDDQRIITLFAEAKKFPNEIKQALGEFIEIVQTPLAVRSSSLLEDSHNHPFSGVYKTYMIPNIYGNHGARLDELITTVKKVYASTFSKAAKDYIRATSFSLTDEKMAVIIQKMIGSVHNNRFYPNFSGVARSYNFYPIAPQKYTDGIVSMALGLGKMVVEGGDVFRYCPKYPQQLDQFSNKKTLFQNSQKDFFALQLNGLTGQGKATESLPEKDFFVERYPLAIAEEDNTLSLIASTYSLDNDVIYDGISRSGVRLITFAPLLKNDIFPLNAILELVLDMGSWGMGTPVEIEFAVNLSLPPDHPKEFAILQMRPMVLNRDLEVLTIENFKPEQIICQSSQVLGNGIIDDVHDIIIVDQDRFNRGKSRQAAMEIGLLNSQLLSENRCYLLIGVGRWGTLDPWLGIPVTWGQISGAKAIVEAGFKDFTVTPSQGSHFFQNINSFSVGYFTIQSSDKNGFIDWEWLKNQVAIQETEFVRLLRFTEPISIQLSGHTNRGIVIKPEKKRG